MEIRKATATTPTIMYFSKFVQPTLSIILFTHSRSYEFGNYYLNPRSRNVITLGAVAVIVIALAGTFVFLGQPSQETTSPTLRVFTINLQEWGFNQSGGGPTITVRQGDTVRIIVTGQGRAALHDFVIDAASPSPNDVRTMLLANGDSEAIEFVANSAGNFKYYCSVPEHRDRGMEATLTVLR